MIKRADFPLLRKKINNRTIVYFDNAATAQKPGAVIKATEDYYKNYNANVHRGLNPLAAEATRRYEAARDIVSGFIGARREEIVFTRGTTEAINLVARTWGEQNLRAGDIVVLSLAEHHANIVPWLQLKEKRGISIEYIPLRADGSWNLTAAKRLLARPRVKLLALAQVSNVLGLLNPVEALTKIARQKGIITLIDAAQSIAHLKVDVKDLNCDFLAFSAHKLGGPTGVGVLFGRYELLETIPPWLGGGGMISAVTTESFTVADIPYKFEAGTPHIAGVIGLAAACRYLQDLGWQTIKKQEQALTRYFLKKIRGIKYLELLGSGKNKLPIFSLSLGRLHPHDASDLLGQQGIITRAGHHCAQPLHDHFQVPASLRASLSFYNTTEEIDIFFAALKRLHQAFTD